MDDIKKRVFINKQTGQKLISIEEPDFENAIPIEYFYKSFIVTKVILLKECPDFSAHNDKKNNPLLIAFEHWKVEIERLQNTLIPPNLLQLLHSKKKKEQMNLLKDLTVSPDILMALILKAGELGYKLSQFNYEHTPNEIDGHKMPLAFFTEPNGDCNVLGNTKLSKENLKQILKHRKVTVAKFLDKDNTWHCFFITYRSIGGEEIWQNVKQPHYHYISNYFGIDRSEVISQLKSKKYNLGSLPHIKLVGFGKQPV